MRLTALLACLAWACAPAVSLASCGGSDMLATLGRDDPAALAAIETRAAGMPNGEGRFWQVDRPGADPSHLFGTFHSVSAVATVPDAAWAALDKARLAVFEIDLHEQAAIRTRLAENPQLAYDPSAPPLSSRLDPDDLATVRAALTMRGVPGFLGEQMRPWMLFALLSLPACELQAQAMGSQPLDVAFARRADDAGIPQRGLETFDDVIAALERIGPDALLAMLLSDGEIAGLEEDVFHTNLRLYAAGRIATIAAFDDWLAGQHTDDETRAAGDAALAVLIDGRNAAWMPALEDALEDGDAFVAVGALHLGGERGLIELLRARGWTVTRLD